MNKKNIINFILIIIWLFIIFSFSAENAYKSELRSDEVIITAVETVTQEKIPENQKQQIIDKYIVIVRKSAHFFLYFVLGILVMILMKRLFGLSPKAFIYTIIFCFIYACSDEIHQLFISGRTARIFDVFVDTSGSLLSTTIITLINIIINKIKIKKIN